MNDNEDPLIDSEMPASPLPPELAAAVNQARTRQPTPDMVEQLIARASALDTLPQVSRVPRRVWSWSLSVGASIAAVVILSTWLLFPMPQPRGDGLVPQIAKFTTPPVYSTVTKHSLAAAGFQQIAADLKLAEERIAEASEQFVLSEVRRDLDVALAQYRRWGE